MEKGFNSWSRDQQFDWQSLNPNISSAQFALGPQVIFPSFGNMGSLPVRQEPCGWFYGLPRYRQGLIPVVNSVVQEKSPVLSPDVARETNVAQKKFLVFDQSGDQTTLIYSSGVGPAPIRYQFPSSNNPKPQFGSRTVNIDEFLKENDGNDSKSEMREDTEELNALLYSDDDDDYDDDDDDDDDEKSTGHSPSSVTGFREQKQKREIESGEEEDVASSGGPTKKRKWEDEGKVENVLEDTASSGKSGINCSSNGVFNVESDSFSSGNKRMRKEKIKETINLLQNLIPGDKNGKNAIMVIDEAIHYLRKLKVKAKALGLDSL